MNTNQLLDHVKVLYSLPSDYALAKFLGLSPSAIGFYRRKGKTMSDKTALLVADKLDFPPGQVLAWVNAERADCAASKRVYLHLAKLAQRAGIVGFLPLLLDVFSAGF